MSSNSNTNNNYHRINNDDSTPTSWRDVHRQAVLDGTAVLERTSDSIARSNQLAIETEQIGTEVVGELSEQRETLLRTRARLEHANEQLDHTKTILRRMGRNVVYNKLILVLIIIVEVVILAALVYLKFFSGGGKKIG